MTRPLAGVTGPLLTVGHTQRALEDLAQMGLIRLTAGRLFATASGRPVLDRLTAEIAGV